MPRCFATLLGVQRRAGACSSSPLPGTAGGGVDSGVDSFGLDGGGAGFISVFGGGVLLSAIMVMERRCLRVFQPPGHQLSEDPRGRSRLGVWGQYL